MIEYMGLCFVLAVLVSLRVVTIELYAPAWLTRWLESGIQDLSSASNFYEETQQ